MLMRIREVFNTIREAIPLGHRREFTPGMDLDAFKEIHRNTGKDILLEILQDTKRAIIKERSSTTNCKTGKISYSGVCTGIDKLQSSDSLHNNEIRDRLDR